MYGYGTATEEMAQAAQHVLRVDETVQGRLAALRGRLGAQQGMWSGDAAAQFVLLMERWDRDAAALSRALRAIGESISGSEVAYSATEDQQRAAFSTITTTLDS